MTYTPRKPFQKSSSDSRPYAAKGRPDQDGERQIYDSICEVCGVDCKLPFEPSPGRSGLCSACFSKRRNDSDSYGDRGGDRRERSYSPRESSYAPRERESFSSDEGGPSLASISRQLDQIVRKLDAILTERSPAPRSEYRSEYRSEGRSESREPRSTDRFPKAGRISSWSDKPKRKFSKEF